MKERLSKFLSRSGVTSRRKAETIIKDGRVKVNGKITYEPFFDINPEKDHVTIDNISLSEAPQRKVYLALHKPRGYISDLADPKGRPLARDLIAMRARLYPVGRLDFTSEGLMIFTNDGDFTQKVLHPRNQIEREYMVKVQKPLSESDMVAMTAGCTIEGVLYRLDSIKLVAVTEKNAWYRMIATEGRNRMIRRLAQSLGHQVLRLRRIRIGPVALGNLKSGQFRFLSANEVRQIFGDR